MAIEEALYSSGLNKQMNIFWSSSEERRITHGPSFMGENLLRGRNSLSRTIENEKTRGKWKIVRGNIGATLTDPRSYMQNSLREDVVLEEQYSTRTGMKYTGWPLYGKQILL